MESRTEGTRSLKGFWALIGAQFQAAFNDNAYKNLLTVLALYGPIAAGTPEDRKNLTSIIAAVFIFPFLLFSMYGGHFADRYSKRSVSIVTKSSEIGIMLLGALAFFSHHFWISICVLGLMGVHSAFFGPAKYGIIPELVPEKKLSWANGIVELTTFVAIIGGTWAGTQLYGVFQGRLQYAMLILAVFSLLGACSAFKITKVPAAAPDRPFKWNILGEMWTYTRYAHRDRVLWLAMLGNTYFWFIGSVIYLNVASYAPEVLHLKEQEMGLLLVCLAAGIGLGSFVAGVLSAGKIEYGFVPLGAMVMTVCGVVLSMPGLSHPHAYLTLALLGFGGGFFIVPVQSLVQHRPDSRNKGGVQGVAYFLSNAGSLLASVFYSVLVAMHLSPRGVFLASAIVTLGVTVYLVTLLPDSLLRLGLWLLGHSMYRLRVVGRDNIPERGGALFLCNHVSFADALFIVASTDRHVRFIMHSDYYNMPLVRPFAKLLRAIPISGEAGPRALIRALRDASQAVKNGEVVCIFPEGQITRTGQLLPFRRGFERIMKGVEAPMIPVHLDRVWGSIFSFEKGRFLWKWPRRFPYPVTVSYGAPMPPTSTTSQVRHAVQELGTAAFAYRREQMRPLQRQFVHEAHWHWRRFAMADGQNPSVSLGQVLVRSVVLGRKLKSRWAGQEMVGLLMPPSTAGACLNVAALLCGKVPVNLNYTASREAFASAIEQCGIKTVVSARAFLEKVKVEVPVEVILLEDLVPTVSLADKLFGWLSARLLPAWLIEKLLGSRKRWQLDDMATIIFSSGSTGEPKGVMLSHYNVQANCQGIGQVMSVDTNDRVLGILPFFHSFGFTGTLWFPLTQGIGSIFHPNPMDARTIGGLVAKYAVTLLVATPTFLQGYIRRVEPGQFGSLRFVLVGAEKLPERVALAFEDRFGIRPYEAYGTTECAPAVTINVPSYRAAGFYQVGGKREHIGHPLPGVSVRIVDPQTYEPLGVGQQGLLLVKGPNVMLGYLGKPEKTREVMMDGWYVTGDIAAMDEDGFLMVTDRLSRFSKIGGEMVPHIRVEDKLHELAQATQQCFAVTGVPDERKGEKLVVLHTLDEEALRGVLEKLPRAGLPNLWTPRADAFFRIGTIPVLGTGKMDLREIRRQALSMAEEALSRQK